MKDSLNILLVGESGVGCNQLSNITSGSGFNEGEPCVTGHKYITKNVFIKNKEYGIRLWNGPGQEKYRGLRKTFLKMSNIVIFVYDITDSHSFLELNYHINMAKEVLGDKFKGAIVGNKSDLYEKEKITEEEVRQLAKNNGYKYKFVSAKCDPNSFIFFLEELVEDYFNEFKPLKKDKKSIEKEIRENNLKGKNLKIILSKYFNY